MRIWLNGNEEAHSFISSDYWHANLAAVQEQILQADVFVYEDDGEIQGFIGMVDGYIAGIFVNKIYRSYSIGRQLLEYVKQIYSMLSLSVYQKNKRAIAFYLRESFSILSEKIDEATGEREYMMVWKDEQKME